MNRRKFIGGVISFSTAVIAGKAISNPPNIKVNIAPGSKADTANECEEKATVFIRDKNERWVATECTADSFHIIRNRLISGAE